MRDWSAVEVLESTKEDLRRLAAEVGAEHGHDMSSPTKVPLTMGPGIVRLGKACCLRGEAELERRIDEYFERGSQQAKRRRMTRRPRRR